MRSYYIMHTDYTQSLQEMLRNLITESRTCFVIRLLKAHTGDFVQSD